jgi:hypothetical protein
MANKKYSDLTLKDVLLTTPIFCEDPDTSNGFAKTNAQKILNLYAQSGTFAFDATIGASGADYTTINAAHAAGKYILKQVDDVTEINNTIISQKVQIVGNKDYSINFGNYNLSGASGADLIILNADITTNFTSANRLFSGTWTNKNLKIDFCDITNNSSINNCLIANYGLFQNCTVNLGNIYGGGFGDFTGFYGILKNVDIIGGGVSCEASVNYGIVAGVDQSENVRLSGTFKSTSLNVINKVSGLVLDTSATTLTVYDAVNVEDKQNNNTITVLYNITNFSVFAFSSTDINYSNGTINGADAGTNIKASSTYKIDGVDVEVFYDATVGGSGQYTTIRAAYLAGAYILKQVGNITELNDTTIAERVEIYGNKDYTIDFGNYTLLYAAGADLTIHNANITTTFASTNTLFSGLWTDKNLTVNDCVITNTATVDFATIAENGTFNDCIVNLNNKSFGGFGNTTTEFGGILNNVELVGGGVSCQAGVLVSSTDELISKDVKLSGTWNANACTFNKIDGLIIDLLSVSSLTVSEASRVYDLNNNTTVTPSENIHQFNVFALGTTDCNYSQGVINGVDAGENIKAGTTYKINGSDINFQELVTVGSGGVYTELQDALDDSKFNMLLVGNITATKTTAIGANNVKINLNGYDIDFNTNVITMTTTTGKLSIVGNGSITTASATSVDYLFPNNIYKNQLTIKGDNLITINQNSTSNNTWLMSSGIIENFKIILSDFTSNCFASAGIYDGIEANNGEIVGGGTNNKYVYHINSVVRSKFVKFSGTFSSNSDGFILTAGNSLLEDCEYAGIGTVTLRLTGNTSHIIRFNDSTEKVLLRQCENVRDSYVYGISPFNDDNLNLNNVEFVNDIDLNNNNIVENCTFNATLDITGDNNQISKNTYLDDISVTGDSNDITGNLGTVLAPKTLTLQAGVKYNKIDVRTANNASVLSAEVVDNSGNPNNVINRDENSTQLT